MKLTKFVIPSKRISHFLTNDLWFAVSYFIAAVVYLALSIPSFILPYKSHFIILGGLIPALLILLIPLGLLIASLVSEDKKEIYKNWMFWILITDVLVLLIGNPVCWHYLVSDFTKYADTFGNDNAGLHNPYLVEITTSLWMDVIMTFCVFASSIVLLVFIWRMNADVNKTNSYDDDKQVQKFIDETHAQIEVGTSLTTDDHTLTNQEE